MSLEEVRDRIAEAERRSGCGVGSVDLVAVSKMQTEDRVRSVLEAGQRVFGENRVQEAQTRWGALKPEFPRVELHLIGPLQTNKVKSALALFDVIQSVDREKLARKIADEIQSLGVARKLFIQVNTGEEPQKAGVSPAQVDEFVLLCRQEYEMPIAGLMAIPPAHEPPAPHFALLAKLAERNGLAELSMGMSADFEIAIELGATAVRVGSAVFGERPAATPTEV